MPRRKTKNSTIECIKKELTNDTQNRNYNSKDSREKLQEFGEGRPPGWHSSYTPRIKTFEIWNTWEQAPGYKKGICQFVTNDEPSEHVERMGIWEGLKSSK